MDVRVRTNHGTVIDGHLVMYVSSDGIFIIGVVMGVKGCSDIV